MSQTKTFYLERGPINPPELHSANEDELIKVYASNDDAMTDLANMDDNEVFATRDNDYLGAVIVDKVEDGNYNPLTSNAVFDYIQDQIELSEYEDITISASSGSPTVMPYDGFITMRIGIDTDTTCYLYINERAFQVLSSGLPRRYRLTMPVKKGDRVYMPLGLTTTGDSQAAFYKLRDYSRRS